MSRYDCPACGEPSTEEQSPDLWRCANRDCRVYFFWEESSEKADESAGGDSA